MSKIYEENNGKELVEEWFADCIDPAELARLYADIKLDIERQLDFCMECLTSKE